MIIKISGHEIWRDGQKIGSIEGHHIREHEGDEKMGYFDDSGHVYDMNAHKIAYIEGDYLRTTQDDKQTPLEKIREKVEGSSVSEVARCAVYLFLGD